MNPCAQGNRPGSARPTLEPLEQRVLELIGQGCSHSEVAEQLGIPVELVRAHLRAISEKLGVSSTIEALIVATRQGLIRLPPR